MMTLIGEKSKFAIEYDLESLEEIMGPDAESKLNMWINDSQLCSFSFNNYVFDYYVGNVHAIARWFKENIDTILKEERFPFDIEAKSSLDFCKKYIDSIPNIDDDNFDSICDRHEQYQAWDCAHSWLNCREGRIIADVYFRRVGDKVEIEWDNTKNFDDVTFVNPKGIEYVYVDLFTDVISRFVSDILNK